MDQREHAGTDVSGRWLAVVWALVLAFFVAGVFGRSLWKADEPYSFGIVWEMLEDHRWLIPHIAGQPFVEKPPLVYWVAAIFANALPRLQPDQSARLAVLLFAGIGIGALYAAARRLYPEAAAWRKFVQAGDPAHARSASELHPNAYATLAVLLMAGTLGVAEHIHKLTADTGQLAGAIMGLAGMICVGTSDAQDRNARARQRSSVAGGLLLGNGIGVAFLAKGLLVPALLMTTCIVSLLLPAFRNRVARRAYVVASVVALPWLVIWPAMFYAASPELFGEWLWSNNVGRFLGSTLLGGNHRTVADKVGSMLAAGFPAILLFPFVAWRTLRASAGEGPACSWTVTRSAPGHSGVAIFLLISVAVLGMSASMRDVYLLPLLPALVLLSLPALLSRAAHASGAARRVAVLAFGAMAATVFAVWIALVTTGDLTGFGRLGQLLGRALPLPYSLAMDWPAVVMAIASILAWLYITRRDSLRSATVAWCAGVAMTWVVGAALLLPWIDSARSYKDIFGEIASQVSAPRRCVATLNLGESEIAMLEYLTGIEATRAHLGHSGSGNRDHPNPAISDCDWLIALSNLRPGPPPPDPQRWLRVRTLSRPADRNEHFTLYRSTETVKVDRPRSD